MNKILEHPYINKSAVASDLIEGSSCASSALRARVVRGKVLMGDERDKAFLEGIRELRDAIDLVLREEAEKVESRKKMVA